MRKEEGENETKKRDGLGAGKNVKCSKWCFMDLLMDKCVKICTGLKDRRSPKNLIICIFHLPANKRTAQATVYFI